MEKSLDTSLDTPQTGNFKGVLIGLSILLALILFIMFTSDGFRNLVYKYKLPNAGLVSNLQSAVLPKMNIGDESSSEEPSSSEEINNGWARPEQSELLIGLYSSERANMQKRTRFGYLKPMTPEQDSCETDNEDIRSRLENASNSAFLN